jgi:hypothetical protein
MDKEPFITIAETLNEARIQATPAGPHAALDALSGRISSNLYETLMLLVDEIIDVNTVYEAILDGKTVREALKIVEEEEE